MSLRFHGQLLVHVLKCHGYMEGLPFAGDPSRVPRGTIRIGDSEVSTRRWQGGGEVQWDERFLFHVDADGTEPVTFTFHINLHGAERAVGAYTTSLATALSQVGPQWHQARAIMAPGVTDAIKGELCVQVRWYPIGGPEPAPEVVAKCSAVVDASGKAVEASTSLASRTSRLSLSVPSNSSGSSGSPSASPSSSPQSPASLPKVQSLPSLSHAASLESSSGGTTTPTPGEFSEEEKAQLNRHRLFPSVQVTPPSAHASAAHFVHSSSLHGRMHADTRMFDDRNFLENFASTSHIHEIVVWHHTRILGLQTIFFTQSLRIPAPLYGPPPTLSPSILTLHPDELLLSIGGRRDDDGIRALTFVTNRQRRSFGLVDEVGMGGGLELGEDFVCQAPRGCRVVCLYGGWNGRGINCLGMCYQHVESGATGLMPVIVEERAVAGGKNGTLGGGSEGAPRGPLTKQSTARHI